MISASIQLSRGTGFNLDVDLTFERSVTALFGHSGAGKSSILQVIAGLERGGSRDHVTVSCDGDVWQDAKTFTPPHMRHVGYVFQQAQLFPHLSARGNLKYAEKRAQGTVVPIEKLIRWLDLEPLLDRDVASLSGGESQRVAIARALLAAPRCLLMDEPLGSLDQVARRKILPYLARIREELSIPMIYVTHSMDEVNFLADRIHIIESGKVVYSGSVIDASATFDVAMNHDAEPGVVVECLVRGYDEEFELVELALGDERLFVASDRLNVGSRIRVRVPARDVSLAMTKPTDTSILNILPARVDAIDAEPGRHFAIIRLTIGDQPLLASITRKSLASLDLAQGQNLFAQVKGVALLTDVVSTHHD